MKLEDINTNKRYCYWAFSKPVECKLTGRVVKSISGAATFVEIKTGWFSRSWIAIQLLDEVEEIE